MQRSWVTNKDRAGALVAVVVIHVGLIGALLTLGGQEAIEAAVDPVLQTFDVSLPEPPPPEPAAIETRRTPEEEGASAPPAKKAEATEVVRPKPRVELPPEPTIVAAETPGSGSAPTQGAAPVDGPGSGAGGDGAGTGSGSGGSGPGGGGEGVAERPSLISRSLTQRDYSSASRRNWPSGKRVMVSFDVQLNGRASGCRIVQSSGVESIDSETCRLVTSKLRFRPARDRSGRPVVQRYGYIQYPLF